MHNSGIVPLTAAGIVGLRGALDGQHEGNVAQTHHLFAERLIDEGGVGVDGKLHIIVLLRQLEDISLTHQRLAAGQHVQVHAQLLALGNNLVHILKVEVILVTVFTGPAAHAVHIAGGSGVEQDQPGGCCTDTSRGSRGWSWCRGRKPRSPDSAPWCGPRWGRSDPAHS